MAKGNRGGKRSATNQPKSRFQKVVPASTALPAGKRQFKNKNDLISFVEEQTNIKLDANEGDRMNLNRNVLYTKVDPRRQTAVFKVLKDRGIPVEAHLSNYYWIHFKKGK